MDVQQFLGVLTDVILAGSLCAIRSRTPRPPRNAHSKHVTHVAHPRMASSLTALKTVENCRITVLEGMIIVYIYNSHVHNPISPPFFKPSNCFFPFFGTLKFYEAIYGPCTGLFDPFLNSKKSPNVPLLTPNQSIGSGKSCGSIYGFPIYRRSPIILLAPFLRPVLTPTEPEFTTSVGNKKRSFTFTIKL